MKRSLLLCGLGAVCIGSRQSVGANDNRPNRLRKDRQKSFDEMEREANERFYDLGSLSDAEVSSSVVRLLASLALNSRVSTELRD